MKHSHFKRRTSFPILFIHFLLISHLAFSQTNSNVKKEGNVGIEPFLVNLGKTIEEEMIRLDSIDDNYLTRLSGLITYDRVYLSKNSEKQFFSKEALDSLRMPKMNRELKCLSEALYFEARGEQIEGQIAVADVITVSYTHLTLPTTPYV